MDSLHPRPAFQRDAWYSLDGPWQCSLQEEDNPGRIAFERTIRVPFPPESPASGVGEKVVPVIWYRRAFQVPERWRGRRVVLPFGAVDYQATVWLNGHPLVRHEGGHPPFSVDLTPYLREEENELWVQAQDDPEDCESRLVMRE